MTKVSRQAGFMWSNSLFGCAHIKEPFFHLQKHLSSVGVWQLDSHLCTNIKAP